MGARDTPIEEALISAAKRSYDDRVGVMVERESSDSSRWILRVMWLAGRDESREVEFLLDEIEIDNREPGDGELARALGMVSRRNT